MRPTPFTPDLTTSHALCKFLSDSAAYHEVLMLKHLPARHCSDSRLAPGCNQPDLHPTWFWNSQACPNHCWQNESDAHHPSAPHAGQTQQSCQLQRLRPGACLSRGHHADPAPHLESFQQPPSSDVLIPTAVAGVHHLHARASRQRTPAIVSESMHLPAVPFVEGLHESAVRDKDAGEHCVCTDQLAIVCLAQSAGPRCVATLV